MSERESLTSSQPYPAPLALPAGYRRHHPSTDELLAAIDVCVADQPWPELSWSELIEALLAVGRTDIPLARLVEGHVDALRILAQAGCQPKPAARYGVWASRSRQTGVRADPDGNTLRLTGRVRFASGAGIVDRALVPVWFDDEHHRLLDLDVRAWTIDSPAWVTSAMEVTRSDTVAVEGVMAEDAAVGPIDFYLGRPGFFPGGIGVAACWAGGAGRVTDLLLQRPSGTWHDHNRARLGASRVALAAAAAAVRSGARLLDHAGSRRDLPHQQIATEVRAVTASAVTEVLQHARRIGGGAGAAHDEDFTRAVHDLDLYVLQQNADGDHLYLGSRYLA